MEIFREKLDDITEISGNSPEESDSITWKFQQSR